jgi:hypothetical protein
MRFGASWTILTADRERLAAALAPTLAPAYPTRLAVDRGRQGS